MILKQEIDRSLEQQRAYVYWREQWPWRWLPERLRRRLFFR
jgi:hypothetical protein